MTQIDRINNNILITNSQLSRTYIEIINIINKLITYNLEDYTNFKVNAYNFKIFTYNFKLIT